MRVQLSGTNYLPSADVRVLGAATPLGGTTNYSYNADGERVAQTSNGTTTIYAGGL
ncbi:MAG: hypothetical protein NVS2B7_16350 [Herpetosiphon sp.]